MIILILGAVALFIWSKLSPKTPTEKTEILESPLPEPRKDIIDVFKENVPKVAAIVSGAGATLAKTVLPAATALPGAVTAPAILSSIALPALVPLTALPAATVLPAGVVAMAPTTLASATFSGGAAVTPAVVGTGAGTSSVGAGAGGLAGGGSIIAGAAIAVAPLVIVPLIAKFLDSLIPPPVPFVMTPEIRAERTATRLDIEARTKAGEEVLWSAKTGYWAEKDDPTGGFSGRY